LTKKLVSETKRPIIDITRTIHESYFLKNSETRSISAPLPKSYHANQLKQNFPTVSWDVVKKTIGEKPDGAPLEAAFGPKPFKK